MLFAAARSDHVERRILPALERGDWVLSDRFLDSSLAYQGEAGGLGMEAVRDLHRFAAETLPDRTLVLILDEAEGAVRARSRDGHLGDRIGSRPPSYHAAVEAGFRIGRPEPERVKLIDASGPPATVTAPTAICPGESAAVIVGQDKAVDQFTSAWASHRLHHGWLLVGPKALAKPHSRGWPQLGRWLRPLALRLG